MVATTGIAPSELRRWPASDFAALQALYAIQPWGAERDNAHFAMLASMYASAHTPKGKRRPRMSDYMLHVKARVSDRDKIVSLRNYLKSAVKENV